MESWGVKSLESDAGLDVLDSLSTYIEKTPAVKLDELIVFFQEKGFLPNNNDNDFFYDISAIAITELLFEYLETGSLAYEGAKSIKSWSYKEKEIDYLKNFLEAIYHNKEDHQGIYDQWDGNKEWLAYIENLITKLRQLKK